MRGIIQSVAGSLLLLMPLLASAQAPNTTSRWSMEATVDAAVPTGDLGTAELNNGFGFGANLRVRLQPHLLGYAGWEWHRFTSDQLVASASTDVEDTGYSFGLRFEHPFREDGNTGFWLRAGGLWNHIELEDADGEIFADTKHGLGYEAGGGVLFVLSDRTALTPGVRVRSLTRELELGTTTSDVTLRYVTATVGLTIAF